MSHALLAPSSSHRWMHCTASPLLVEELAREGKILRDKETVYSLEGTTAHEWAAKVLEKKCKLSDVPEDYRGPVGIYVNICKALSKGASITLVEQKAPLFYSRKETGTMDFAAVHKRHIDIRDYKHGQGVPVDAVENTQQAIYGLSLIRDLESWYGEIPDHMTITLGIVQPRYRGDDIEKIWETTVGELNEFCADITVTARRIMKANSSDELEFKPSAEVCQFCPAKSVCPARVNAAFEHMPFDVSAVELFENLDMPAIESLGLEQLAALLRNKKQITTFLENAEEHLTAIANSGKKVPGMKLVIGRQGNRAWVDENKVITKLKKLGIEPYAPREVVSPKVAEDALKEHGEGSKEAKAVVDALTSRSEGKPHLVPEEDKRPAIGGDVSLFEIVTDEIERE